MEKLLFVLTALLSILMSATTAQESTDAWVRRYLSHPNNKEETVERLHFYNHDFLSGANATVWEVARSQITSNSTTSFGQVRVFDNLLTAEPNLSSEEVGRLQGIVTSADMHQLGLAVNANFVFTTGPYNGSTLSVVGRNAFDSEINRELAVVGGTGVFRMARGFSICNTLYNDNDYAVIEYVVYVFLWNFPPPAKSFP